MMTKGVGMKFSQLAFIVTDDCNFNCAYCRQIKDSSYMKRSTIDKVVDFFYPFLDDETYIIFYGGEPLLAFDNIKYAVSLLQEKNRDREKKLKFSLTTNGSLITDEVLHFFDSNHFIVTLSFDGLAQDLRKPGSMVPIRELIRHIQGNTYSGITFSTNSIFTPGTVSYLTESLKYIVECGVTDLLFDLVQDMPWDETALMTLEKELAGLTDFLVSYYKEKGTIPVNHYRRAQSPAKSTKNVPCFTCAAGFQRMAITPEENVWGCYLFHDYLKNREESSDFHTYWFGKLDDYIKNHETLYPLILLNYAALRQDFFFTGDQHCFLCQEVESCGICPVSAAYATSFIGKLPPWICGMHSIQRKVGKSFLEEIEIIDRERIFIRDK
jgi:uncharacterized protein